MLVRPGAPRAPTVTSAPPRRTTTWFCQEPRWATDDGAARKSINSFLTLALSVRSQDGYTVVTISGELDTASAPVLRERFLDLLRPSASRIVIELSGVTFWDVSGLAVLVGASHRASLLGGVLRLAAPAPLVATGLRLTGLGSRFEIFASAPEAIGAPGSRDAGVPKPRACWSALHAAGEFHGTAAVGGRVR
jgi:anti-anti-sigma factor